MQRVSPLMVGVVLVTLLLTPVAAPPASARPAPGAGLTVLDRTACTRAVQEVFWRHRLWPAENPGPKPPLDAVLPPGAAEARALDALRMSQALETYWGEAVTAAQLQAEIERMAAETQQPQVLREVWEALDSDPARVAECLARPVLAERLLRGRYAYDDRFHGDLHRTAQEALAAQPDPSQWPSLSAGGARYQEIEWTKDAAGAAAQDGALSVPPAEWDARVAALARQIGTGATPVPGLASSLQEDAQRFYALAVLALDSSRLRLAVVEWPKETFDAWWQRVQAGIPPAPEDATPYPYHLPAPPDLPADFAWEPTAGVPEGTGSVVWTGTEMIVWGGGNGLGGKLNSGSRYNPATDMWRRTAAVGAPYPRNSQSAVWTGTEMIVWAGCALGDNHNCAINTGGRYDPVNETWTPTSMVNVPEIRFGHTAVWTGNRMIVWGGCRQINDACTPSVTGSTGGIYDPATNTWTPTSTAGAPSPRAWHTAVWTGSRMIVWGGYDGGSTLNSGGIYDPATNTWQPLSQAGAPSGRVEHTAVWTGSLMIIWGGCPGILCYSGLPPVNTGGRYDPASNTWTPVTGIQAPSERTQHTAVWTGSEMIVWGGTVISGQLNTGARYNPVADAWTPTSQSGAPTPRAGHVAVWTGTRMVIWGATSDKTGGRYDPATDSWGPTNAEDPFSFRADHTAVWTGSEMIVWGGNDAGSGTTFGFGIRYNPALATWTPASTVGEPFGRMGHTAVWTGLEMIVWGGQYGNYPFNEGGRYNPTSDTWAATTVAGAPEAKSYHSAVWTGSEMIVWGGSGNTYNQNTGGRYNPATDSWTAVTTTGAPLGRYLHTAVWTGSEMIVWGGAAATGDTNTGGRYNPGSNSWQPVTTAGAPEARHFQSALWLGERMWVWGGKTGDFSGGTLFNTGGLYDPVANTWQATSLTNAPNPRFYHSAVWTGSVAAGGTGEIIVWGGCSAPGCYTQEYTGAHYDPATNTWTGATQLRLAPSARSLHSTVWTGTAMIIWGGQVGETGGYTTTGGIYAVAPAAAFKVYTPYMAR